MFFGFLSPMLAAGPRSIFDILLSLRERISAEPDAGPVSSVGSSHSALTPGEGQRRGITFGLSAHRSLDGRMIEHAEEKRKQPYIPGLYSRIFPECSPPQHGQR